MTEFDIEECRRRCELTMKNTASGKWLGAALDRLEYVERQLRIPHSPEQLDRLRKSYHRLAVVNREAYAALAELMPLLRQCKPAIADRAERVMGILGGGDEA